MTHPTPDPLREALAFYTDDANWRQNGPLDPNSANFTGGPARAALAAAPQPAPALAPDERDEMMLADAHAENDTCSFSEALSTPPPPGAAPKQGET